MINDGSMELHPLCSLFPRIDGTEFENLVADIKKNGLSQPIVVANDMILDGGNRFRACMEAGVEPQFVEFSGPNLVAYVLSANLHRRHMSAGQQAAIVAAATDWTQTNAHGGNRKTNQVLPHERSRVKDRVALSGASVETQVQADRLTREHPEHAAEVRQGSKSLYRAMQETRESESTAKPFTKALEIEKLKAVVKNLKAELAEAVNHIGNLTDELSALVAVSTSEEAKTIRDMTLNLRATEATRDNLLNENAELKKHIARLETKIGYKFQ